MAQDAEHHDNHGQTPAAWTAVTIIMVGFLVGCIAVVQLNWVLLGVAVGIVVLGAVVGKVMQMMGMGKQDDRGPGHDAIGTTSDATTA